VIKGVPQEDQRRPLAEVDILTSLSPEEIQQLALLTASVKLGAGETLALDEERRALLLLINGRVRVREPNASGPGFTISMVEIPTVVTLRPRTACRRARTPCPWGPQVRLRPATA
jgi:hypothetical protein